MEPIFMVAKRSVWWRNGALVWWRNGALCHRIQKLVCEAACRLGTARKVRLPGVHRPGARASRLPVKVYCLRCRPLSGRRGFGSDCRCVSLAPECVGLLFFSTIISLRQPLGCKGCQTPRTQLHPPAPAIAHMLRVLIRVAVCILLHGPWFPIIT